MFSTRQHNKIYFPEYLAIALWNLVEPDKQGRSRQFRLVFQSLPPEAWAQISTVDHDHGNVLAVYQALGSPRYPTMEQIQKMNAATALPEPKRVPLTNSRLELELSPNALALLVVTHGSE